MHAYPDGVRLEDRPCPNGCAPQDGLVLEAGDRLHGIAGQFRVVCCAQCGLQRTNPRPTPDTIGVYYPADYGPYHIDAAPTPSSPGRKLRLKAWLGLDTRRLPPIPAGRLLELGCASGAYMEELRRAGWAVEGIEFSAEAAEQARAKSLKVQVATVESAEPPERSVDVIAAWMVLEHLHEPVAALRKLRGWVKPDGYLVASVPDAGAWERRLFADCWYALQLPTHLYHYDPKSLAGVLRSAGWELVRVRWQPNCNNLLSSLQYWANERGHRMVGRAVQWLRTARTASKLRILLGWLLGRARQSGRIEIWARPAQDRP